MLLLLFKKRFGPFFLTMGLGAFNDNLFKGALAIFIAYNLPLSESSLLVQASAGLFILPFFLFSGLSGQISDKYEKSRLIKNIKILEILIMILGAIGFYLKNVPFLLFVIFLMGLQSTLFGPIKYSILPQHLEPKELIRGNALTSGGTFLAILFGTILGGILVAKDVVHDYGHLPICLSIILTAILGAFASYLIPQAQAADTNLSISWNPYTQALKTLKIGFENKSIFFALLGISWFWFFGFFFMASLPIYANSALGVNEQVATFLLTNISIGMGLGSILSDFFSKHEPKFGVVIFAGLLLGLFGADLYSIGYLIPIEGLDEVQRLMNLDEFLKIDNSYRVFFDLLMIGISGGLFIVPLYTHIQMVSPREHASQIIAANNIINALFMVLAAISSMLLLKAQFNIVEIFLIISALNTLLVIITYFLMPTHLYLIIASMFIRTIYRFKVKGEHNMPRRGQAALLVSNHVSFIDPLILASALARPPRFIMDKMYFDMPLLKWFFKQTKCIPITPAKLNPKRMENALDEAVQVLKEGHLLVVFPEGFITSDGNLIPFKNGVERILAKYPVPVVPMAIKGMWGSWFSRIKGKAMKGLPPNRLRAKVCVEINPPIDSDKAKAVELQKIIQEMLSSEN